MRGVSDRPIVAAAVLLRERVPGLNGRFLTLEALGALLEAGGGGEIVDRPGRSVRLEVLRR